MKILDAIYEQLPGLISGLISGIIITIVGLSFSKVIFINQDIKLESELLIDSSHLTQGESSLRWQFEIQPNIGTRFSKVKEVGCYTHLELCPNAEGKMSGIDLSEYKELIFSAKANISNLIIDEFNIFIGKEFIRYIYDESPILIQTYWQDYHIDLKKFNLAPLVNKTTFVSDKNVLLNLIALGLDIKTDGAPRKGRFWIDNVRLISKNGQVYLISDCDSMLSIFQGKKLRWISGANEYDIK